MKKRFLSVMLAVLMFLTFSFGGVALGGNSCKLLGGEATAFASTEDDLAKDDDLMYAYVLTEAEALPQDYVDYDKIINGVEKTTIKLSSETTKSGIKISWTKAKGYAVDYYEIYRSTKKDSGYGTEPYYTTKSGSTKSYTDKKGLKKGKTYYYKVKGVREIDGVKYYTKFSNKAYRKAPTTSPVPVESGEMIVQSESYARTVSIDIKTSSGKNYYVYFDSQDTSEKDNAVYIEGGDTVTVYLPGGKYKIYYCSGNTWYGKDSKFGSSTVGAMANGVIELQAFSSYEITLYSVRNGNLGTRSINMSNFPG